MSIAAYALAVRNHLRTNLTNFYTLEAEKVRNCKIMEDDSYTTPDCGREFISVVGGFNDPVQTPEVGIYEDCGININVFHRVSDIPPDYRGEASWADDNSKFALSWMGLEARCREVVKLIHYNYLVMTQATPIVDQAIEFLEPLRWKGTDGRPTAVGAEAFVAGNDSSQLSDNVYGLKMQVRFGGAIRLQPLLYFDEAET